MNFFLYLARAIIPAYIISNMFETSSYIYYGVFVIVAIIVAYSWITKTPIKEIISKLSPGNKTPRGSNTPYLDQYATDFTHLAKTGTIDPVIGRETEVKKLSQVLARRTKNNAILTGEPGVGKTAIAEGLAQRIAKGDVPEALRNKRLLTLDVTGLLSGTKYRGEFENRAKKIVAELSAAKRSIILFVDEFHSIVQSQGAEGAINLSDILKPALARGDLQMIGATTTGEYNKYIKTDSSLERRFQPIHVDEPTNEETLKILQGVKDKYREYHKVEFTDAALESAVDLTQKYIEDRKLPDKAIDAIDEAAAMIRVSHVHVTIPAVLYQAAVKKHPEVADLWKQIQNLDNKIRQNENGNNKSEWIKKREALEDTLDGKGVVMVDSDDIEKVVTGWVNPN